MQNRQIGPRGVYLSLLAAVAGLCVAAGLYWLIRGQDAPAPPRYLLKDSGGHVALYTAEGTGPLATYEEIYTRLLPERRAGPAAGCFCQRRGRAAAPAGGLWPVAPGEMAIPFLTNLAPAALLCYSIGNYQYIKELQQ